ncbi:hypothetical protein V5O48_011754 [Marasmius crinis-equi]|uniref:Uncharacterized protein n=1 Tax=Marasmius crinis-equi TaxID=585013 RepID=A0ABR3F4T0_9AGAR
MAVPPLTWSSPVSLSELDIRAEYVARQDTSSTFPPSLGQPTDANITEVRITPSAEQRTDGHVGGIVEPIIAVLWFGLLAYCIWRPRKKVSLNGGSGNNTDHVRSGDSDIGEDGLQLDKRTNPSVLDIEEGVCHQPA